MAVPRRRTLKEWAHLFDIDPQELHHMVHTGMIKARAIGGEYQITANEFYRTVYPHHQWRQRELELD